MTLPKEPARLPHFPVRIDREKWEVAKNRCPPRVQSAFKEVKIRESTVDLSTTVIIEPSDAKFYSQAVLAPPDWRFCIDYRALNDASDFQSRPLPNTSHMFDRIGTKKAKFFGIIDLTQGFHQIALSPGAGRSSAFITYNGVRQYTRLSFGMKGGPSWFNNTWPVQSLKTICATFVN